MEHNIRRAPTVMEFFFIWTSYGSCCQKKNQNQILSDWNFLLTFITRSRWDWRLKSLNGRFCFLKTSWSGQRCQWRIFGAVCKILTFIKNCLFYIFTVGFSFLVYLMTWTFGLFYFRPDEQQKAAKQLSPII